MSSDRVIDALVALESNVSELYNQFATMFEDDRTFWLELAKEEEVHAQIIGENRELLAKHLLLSNADLTDTANIFEMLAQRVSALSCEFQAESPSQKEIYLSAIQIEQSAGEYHLNKLAKHLTDSRAKQFFQKINNYDHDHAERIRTRLDDLTAKSHHDT